MSNAHELKVSILARPEGRALHEFLGPFGDLGLVSILARPEGRALLISSTALNAT